MDIASFKNYEVPFPMQADAYTASSDIFASNKAREKSVYNTTNRISPARTFPDIAKDSRMVFFGVQDYIRRNLTKPITHSEIVSSKLFMERANSFGGALPFNQEMWYSVLYDYEGYLPIKIESLPEGSVFFPNEPVIQVYGANGFGELAAHIEGVMLGMWSNLTCRATITAHWKNSIRNILIDEYGNDPSVVDGVIDWFIHDFGLRASSNATESETMGRAHLLFFNGTDTFNAAYSAWRDSRYSSSPVGTSILALAHRNILGYENDVNDGELECFKRLYEVSSDYGGIASYVSDCYNFKKAVDKLEWLIQQNPDNANIVVSRPDSGDATDNIEYILNKNNKKLRFIEGNGVKPKQLLHTLACLKNKDVFKRGIFGVGGYLRNSCNRDALSSKYALCSIGNEDRPVCKLSEELGKVSIPGPTILDRNDKVTSVKLKSESLPNDENKLELFYNGTNIHADRYMNGCLEDFDKIRDRANKEFFGMNDFSKANPNFGLTAGHLSSAIQNLRQDCMKKHKE